MPGELEQITLPTKKPLDQFELAAKALFEDALERLLGTHLQPAMVIAQLQSAVLESAGAEDMVANQYTLALHPADLRQLKAIHPTLATELRDALAAALAETDQKPAGALHLLLLGDEAVPRHQLRITADYDLLEPETTRIQHQHPTLILRQISALDAFLIVDGHRHIPLNQPLITLGRSTENDVVIDHPAVSRRHAQIRWRYGHFILYDTGSRGGIFVDDRPVQEWMCQPGDLIYLSRRVPLIYGEGVEHPQRLLSLAASAGDETMSLPGSIPEKQS
jgi:hypothetical protein